MDPRYVSVLPDGPLPNSGPSQSPPPRRRLSMDEDFYYQHIMTQSDSPPRPSSPPPYQVEPPQARHVEAKRGSAFKSKDKGTGKGKEKSKAKSKDRGKPLEHTPTLNHHCETESLPGYSCSINLEGVFMKKHEIEDTIKKAEDRRWHTQFITLTGTALNVYSTKKDWSWRKTRDGPAISPDNPPWMKKAKLEKSYSLLYADAGIAADYQKRRYVIRIRAETDQFLLSCIELSTFNSWLQALFAAIDVALPIEDRDFPRDMSIPRMQRVQWFRNVLPASNESSNTTPGQTGTDAQATTEPSSEASTNVRHVRRRSSSPDPLPSLDAEPGRLSILRACDAEDTPGHAPVFDNEDGEEEAEEQPSERHVESVLARPPPRIDPMHRLSVSSYPNAAVNPHDGKWIPEHHWSNAHDMLYAKLCYNHLLFRSPRKSHYIISKGKKWYVDWATGRMVRVLPPAYGEVEYFGPWQTIHTENMRI